MKYTYHKGEADKKFNVSDMERYYRDKQELDKFLEKIITPYIKDKNLQILDACCGIGHIIHYLNKISPSSNFFGIDQTSYYIEKAKELCIGDNISFEAGDLSELVGKKKFDISINWKTLSWIPGYEDMMKDLFALTKKHIFLSSLFYEGDIDFETRVREYQKEASKDGFNIYYNTYSLPRFKEYVKSLGAKNIQVYDFDIGIDLKKPVNPSIMSTYTEMAGDGKRLQISGSMLMLWKIMRIDL
jgi:trans-aconitate methyltransferase